MPARLFWRPILLGTSEEAEPHDERLSAFGRYEAITGMVNRHQLCGRSRAQHDFLKQQKREWLEGHPKAGRRAISVQIGSGPQERSSESTNLRAVTAIVCGAGQGAGHTRLAAQVHDKRGRMDRHLRR